MVQGPCFFENFPLRADHWALSNYVLLFEEMVSKMWKLSGQQATIKRQKNALCYQIFYVILISPDFWCTRRNGEGVE